MTGHDLIVMTISGSSAKIHNPRVLTHRWTQHMEARGRSSSSESGHETSVADSTEKKKKKKKHKTTSAGRSPVPRFIFFHASTPELHGIVKDYSWMLMETADGTMPDQSNPKVIIINEPQEDNRVSQWNRVLGNPFTGPGDVMASLHDH